MPVYDPITNVMPLASMVTNATVSAALCDQIRDDLVALRSGWWFRATRSTTLAMSAAVYTNITMDTIAMSDTATADGSITIVGGNVQTTKVGLWLVGGGIRLSSFSDVAAIGLDATDAPGGYAAETVNDSTNAKLFFSVASTVQVTSAVNLFGIYLYTNGSPVVQISPITCLWAVWMGGAP